MHDSLGDTQSEIRVTKKGGEEAADKEA